MASQLLKSRTSKPAMVIAVLLYILPAYVVLTGALRPFADVTRSPLGLPNKLFLDNFKSIAKDDPKQFAMSFLFTAFIALVVSAVVSLSGAAVSYVIARAKSKWYFFLYLVFLAAIIIPTQVMVIPEVFVFDKLHLLSSMFGLLLFDFGASLSLVVFIFVGYLKNVPVEYEEAAFVDGAGRYRIFLSIVLPLMRPAVIMMFVFTFVFTWNDFLNPLVLLGPLSTPTVTTGMYRAIGGLYTTDYGQIYAYALLVSLPVLAVFWVSQKSFVGGLQGGGLRG